MPNLSAAEPAAHPLSDSKPRPPVTRIYQSWLGAGRWAHYKIDWRSDRVYSLVLFLLCAALTALIVGPSLQIKLNWDAGSDFLNDPYYRNTTFVGAAVFALAALAYFLSCWWYRSWRKVKLLLLTAALLYGSGLVLFKEHALERTSANAPVVFPGDAATRVYENRLKPIENAAPLLADHPEYVEPIRTGRRLEAPILINDANADLSVRAWRFSYNARGIIEVPNRLSAQATAIIVVHPWGADDGQGWRTPEPAGAVFHCTPLRNELTLKHMKEIVNPFLAAGRPKVGVVAYSLPGKADPIRRQMYRSVDHWPSQDERKQGAKELADKLGKFSYQGQPVPSKFLVSSDRPEVDYFKQFPGLDASAKFNHVGFWDLPTPIARPILVAERDIVYYDGDGYAVLRDHLKKQGIRHVLLAGYSTDMCVCTTTAGYKNLSKDFNVFLVGDATLATFPGHDTPRFATSAAVAFASIDLFITQVSWVKWQ